MLISRKASCMQLHGNHGCPLAPRGAALRARTAPTPGWTRCAYQRAWRPSNRGFMISEMPSGTLGPLQTLASPGGTPSPPFALAPLQPLRWDPTTQRMAGTAPHHIHAPQVRAVPRNHHSAKGTDTLIPGVPRPHCHQPHCPIEGPSTPPQHSMRGMCPSCCTRARVPACPSPG